MNARPAVVPSPPCPAFVDDPSLSISLADVRSSIEAYRLGKGLPAREVEPAGPPEDLLGRKVVDPPTLPLRSDSFA